MVKQVKTEEDGDTATARLIKDLKPGQKYPTPTPGSGDRVFYESLLRQRPDSVMAQDWCISYGVLPLEESIALFKKKYPDQKLPKRSSSSGSSSTKKKKKIKITEDNYDIPDLQTSGGDGIGVSVL